MREVKTGKVGSRASLIGLGARLAREAYCLYGLLLRHINVLCPRELLKSHHEVSRPRPLTELNQLQIENLRNSGDSERCEPTIAPESLAARSQAYIIIHASGLEI
jgi:hypothetical protein